MSASFEDVLTYGTYYPQAWHHYPDLGEGVTVICDKCRKQPLKRCMGFKDIDLCLTCASVVERGMERPVITPFTPDDPGMVTLMVPEPYRPSSHRPSWRTTPNRPVTRMAPYERRGDRPLTKMVPYS